MSFNSSENKHKIHQNSHVTFDLRAARLAQSVPMPTTPLM